MLGLFPIFFLRLLGLILVGLFPVGTLSCWDSFLFYNSDCWGSFCWDSFLLGLLPVLHLRLLGLILLGLFLLGLFPVLRLRLLGLFLLVLFPVFCSDRFLLGLFPFWRFPLPHQIIAAESNKRKLAKAHCDIDNRCIATARYEPKLFVQATREVPAQSNDVEREDRLEP